MSCNSTTYKNDIKKTMDEIYIDMYIYVSTCYYILQGHLFSRGHLSYKPLPWHSQVREQSGWIGCCDIGRSWELMFYRIQRMGVGEDSPSLKTHMKRSANSVHCCFGDLKSLKMNPGLFTPKIPNHQFTINH